MKTLKNPGTFQIYFKRLIGGLIGGLLRLLCFSTRSVWSIWWLGETFANSRCGCKLARHAIIAASVIFLGCIGDGFAWLNRQANLLANPWNCRCTFRFILSPGGYHGDPLVLRCCLSLLLQIFHLGSSSVYLCHGLLFNHALMFLVEVSRNFLNFDGFSFVLLKTWLSFIGCSQRLMWACIRCHCGWVRWQGAKNAIPNLRLSRPEEGCRWLTKLMVKLIHLVLRFQHFLRLWEAQ